MDVDISHFPDVAAHFKHMQERPSVKKLLAYEKEGDAIASGSGHISAFKDGPHPNAAQLYVNWFLSRDGQLNWQKHTGRNSFRTDLPKDMLEFQELQVPKEGGKYMLTSLAKYEDIEPVRKLVRELFADGKRR